MDLVLQVLRRVKALQAAGQGTPEWSGHVWQGNQRIMADSRHRLQDLRIAKDAVGMSGAMTDAGALNTWHLHGYAVHKCLDVLDMQMAAAAVHNASGVLNCHVEFRDHAGSLHDLHCMSFAIRQGHMKASCPAGHAPAAPLLQGDGCDAAEGDDAAWDDQRGICSAPASLHPIISATVIASRRLCVNRLLSQLLRACLLVYDKLYLDTRFPEESAVEIAWGPA